MNGHEILELYKYVSIPNYPTSAAWVALPHFNPCQCEFEISVSNWMFILGQGFDYLSPVDKLPLGST